MNQDIPGETMPSTNAILEYLFTLVLVHIAVKTIRPLSVLVHESGHALAGWSVGLRIEEFRVTSKGGQPCAPLRHFTPVRDLLAVRSYERISGRPARETSQRPYLGRCTYLPSLDRLAQWYAVPNH